MATIFGYHRHTQQTYFYGAEKKEGSRKTCTNLTGVELEVTLSRSRLGGGYDSSFHQETADMIEQLIGNRVYFERDGSIGNGFEIITQPHSSREFQRSFKWKSLFNLLEKRGYNSHDSNLCGMHIHFSREMFGKNESRQVNRLAKILYFFSHYRNELIKFSRRTNDSIGWCNIENVTSYKDALRLAKQSRTWNNHRTCWNNGNAHTIECRLLRGTLNYDTFKGSYDFLLQIVRNAQYVDNKDCLNLERWFDNLSNDAIKYLKKKRCFTDYFRTLEQQ